MSQKTLWASLLFFAYGFAWLAGWHFSVNFESVKGLVSLFLPAGVRVLFLLLIPRKHWPIIIVSEIVTISLINFTITAFSSWISQLIGTIGPVGVYVLCMRQYQLSFGQPDPARVKSVLYLGLWVAFAAAITQLVMSSAYAFQGTFSFNVFASLFFAYALGDVVAIAIFLPIIFIAQHLFTYRDEIDFARFYKVFFVAVLLALTMLLGFIYFSEFSHFLKVVVFIPVVLSGYRYGWIGASWAILLADVVIIISSVLVSNFEDAIDAQLFLIYISTSGLFIGAAMSELRNINNNLRHNNRLLIDSNAELSDQKEKCLDLAKRLIDVQEHERSRISMDFHDDLGQGITAIKTNLGVIKKINDDKKIKPVLSSTLGLANDLYEAAYAIMYKLRPHVVGELGLGDALKTGPAAQSLRSANIHFTPNIDGDLGKLDEKMELAVYRITQECINNIVKHSKATQVYLELSIHSEEVHFSIRDNGLGIRPARKDSGERKGYGLQGIEDRAYLIGAEYALESTSSGTTHSLRFKV